MKCEITGLAWWAAAGMFAAELPQRPPIVITPPRSQIVAVNDPVAFEVLAAGSLPLRYQWRFNGSDLPEETNAVLLLSGVTAEQTGEYSVAITNPAGTRESVPAR